jgi:c-di-GMP-binding flagellar brake protein YcgR
MTDLGRAALPALRRKLNITFAGVRFHNISGQAARKVERFVYQLQREARRFDKDDL